MLIVSLHAEPLTPAAFAPFGQVLAPPDDSGQSIGTGCYWPDQLPTPEPRLAVGLITYQQRSLHIARMERHHSGQSFFPLTHSAAVLVVAAGHDVDDPQEVPAISHLKAFLLLGDRGLRLAPGTWHVSPFPLMPTATFAVLAAPRTIEDDSNWCELPAPLTLTITF